MASTRKPCPQDATENSSKIWGELVVQNGRSAGTCWPLGNSIYTIGRHDGCDIRLHSAEVGLWHCVLAQGSHGPVLRNLGNEHATLVNDTSITAHELRDGDRISIGPFLFCLSIVEATSAADGGKDIRAAWRVQIAAVAAQQAALTDEENRLQQQRRGLELQEAQLVKHLDEKRKRLIELRDQARAAHAEMREERARYERCIVDQTREISAMRAEAVDAQQQAQVDRRRLLRLRHQLKQRWHRHWLAERQRIRQQEIELRETSRALARDKEQVAREREEYYRARFRLNGELELARRAINDAQLRLQANQQASAELQTQRERELLEQKIGIDQRFAQLARAEQRICERHKVWEAQRLRLERETKGLDNRIAAQRQKLAEIDSQLSDVAQRHSADGISTRRLNLPQMALPGRAIANELRGRIDNLERMAESLTDDRKLLAEQCRQLLEARHLWHMESTRVAAELKPLALRLNDRENAIAAREAQLSRAEQEMMQRRQYLHAWQTYLDTRAAAWEAERTQLLAEIRCRQQSFAPTGEDADSLQRQLRLTQSRLEGAERYMRELNDTVERMTCVLLENIEPESSAPAARAA